MSATTRPPRPGEEDGVAYHFLTETDFERRLALGEFVEHATYAGHRYGTLRAELERRTRGGAPVVLEIELQGARQIRASMPDAALIFIAPPSIEVLESACGRVGWTTTRGSSGACRSPRRSSRRATSFRS